MNNKRLVPAVLACSFCHFLFLAALFILSYEAGMAHIDHGGEDSALEHLAHTGIAALLFPIGSLAIWAKVGGPLAMAMIVFNSILWGLCLVWLARTFAYVPKESPPN